MSEVSSTTQDSAAENEPKRIFRMLPYPHHAYEIDGGIEEPSVGAFFRVMLAIAWCSFRYPFSTTVIDYNTGKIIENY